MISNYQNWEAYLTKIQEKTIGQVTDQKRPQHNWSKSDKRWNDEINTTSKEYLSHRLKYGATVYAKLPTK